MTAPSIQIKGDKRLLQFNSYEDYLDSLITLVDLGYLENGITARQIAELGYRCTGETLSREAFYRRTKIAKDTFFPIYKPYKLISEFITPANAVMRELSLRERANRLNSISTIIFVRNFTEFHFEISGYIDFRARLESENWLPYFEGKEKLRPKKSDLAYYHWRTGKTYLNTSDNYKPIADPKLGLLFKNLHDRRYISVDPGASSPGIGTTRMRIRSTEYEHVILYDHIVRNKT